MAKWVAISKQTHANSGWVPYNNYNFAKQDAVAPLLIAEISNALAHYPLGFIKKENNTFELVALQSLQNGINLFVNNKGQWLAPYIPAHYRSHPFKLLKTDTDQLALCIDEESECFHPNNNEKSIAFFNENIELSEKLQAVMNFLQHTQQNSILTQQIVNQLNQHQLIIEWNLELKSAETESPKPVKGLYKVDETAIQKLNPEILSELAKNGTLSLAYAQLLSEARLQNFKNLYELYARQNKPTEELDLDKFFGEDDDDGLGF